MTTAKEIMVSDVLTVGADVPIYLAIGVLVEQGISGLPVVDDDNVLVGIITEKDMLKLVDDSTVAEGQTVDDYMVKEVKVFSSEERIATIKDFLIERPFRRVPIVDDAGKLVGIVSRRDVIAYYLESRAEIDDLIDFNAPLDTGEEHSEK